MTTVSQICTRALRRLGVLDALHSASSEDAQAALDALNELREAWRGRGVDTLETTAFALSDTFVLFVPPSGDPIDDLTYAGTWDASLNSPTLTTGTGTEGAVYKVSVAGSTTLDDVTSWSLNDYAVFDGTDWVKGKSSARHEGAVVALLAMRLADEYGVTPGPVLASDAIRGWSAMLSDYVKPPVASLDVAWLETATGRYTGTS